MKLLALQRRMARAVMAPLTRGERMRNVSPAGRSMRAEAGAFIKPNDRLTSFERLEIYNRQYWFRILSALTDDFPGLRAVLGDRKFDALAQAYLRDCPNTSFTLRNLGSKLEAWLRKHPRFAGSRLNLAIDMVRLEWADIEAFDGASVPALKKENIAGADPATLRLRLQPYVQLLALRYPVDDLLLAVKGKNQDDDDFASNAVSEKHRSKRVAAVARLKPASIFLVVHRVDYFVYFRRIDQEEFNILTALRAGKTLERAVTSSFRGSSIPEEERPENVAQWFHNWAALGWFCLPDK
jgi:Putative DNA-binding domain